MTEYITTRAGRRTTACLMVETMLAEGVSKYFAKTHTPAFIAFCALQGKADVKSCNGRAKCWESTSTQSMQSQTSSILNLHTSSH